MYCTLYTCTVGGAGDCRLVTSKKMNLKKIAVKCKPVRYLIFFYSLTYSLNSLLVVPSFYRSFSDENINMINKCVYHSTELLYLMFLNILYMNSIQISEVAHDYADPRRGLGHHHGKKEK